MAFAAFISRLGAHRRRRRYNQLRVEARRRVVLDGVERRIAEARGFAPKGAFDGADLVGASSF
jgi:hypothetical protein